MRRGWRPGGERRVDALLIYMIRTLAYVRQQPTSEEEHADCQMGDASTTEHDLGEGRKQDAQLNLRSSRSTTPNSPSDCRRRVFDLLENDPRPILAQCTLPIFPRPRRLTDLPLFNEATNVLHVSGTARPTLRPVAIPFYPRN